MRVSRKELVAEHNELIRMKTECETLIDTLNDTVKCLNDGLMAVDVILIALYGFSEEIKNERTNRE